LQARDLALKFAGNQIWAGDATLSRARVSAAGAILRGWSNLPDTADFLKNLISSSGNRMVRLCAVRALFELQRETALEWLTGRIGSHEELSEQMLAVVAEAPFAEHVVVEWSLSLAAGHPDHACRGWARELIGREMTIFWQMQC